jgi:transcriptional regulator with XRE-family HTH domain
MVRHVNDVTAESLKAQWGMKLREAREALGESRMQLAVRVGCEPSTIYRAENGRGDLERFLTLANALGVELVQ